MTDTSFGYLCAKDWQIRFEAINNDSIGHRVRMRTYPVDIEATDAG